MTRLRFSLLALLGCLVLAGCRVAGEVPALVSTAVVPSLEATITPSLAAIPTDTAVATSPPATAISETPPSPALTSTPPVPTASPTPEITPSPTPCGDPGRMEFGTVDSAIAGEPMRYRIYLPPCYGADGKTYPTLYMFGGNIHDDTIWDALGLDEAASAAIASGDMAPLLIVMPDNGWLANTTTSGSRSYEGFVLDELIPFIERTYCAWPNADGRAVGGLSRGGYWSLMMAFRRADLFRSAGAHSPALIDSFAGPAEDPIITGGTNELGDLRIWVDIGDRDPYLGDARPLHDTLSAAGVPHEWHVIEGTHDEAYWRANLAGYLSWYNGGWPAERSTLPDCALN